MGEPERAKALDPARGQRDEAGCTEAERRQRDALPRADPHHHGLGAVALLGQRAGHGRGRLSHRRCGHAEEGDGDRLLDARPLRDLHRVREVQRRPVGLEGGVGPVALVLGLERLSLHPDLDLDAGGDLVEDRAHVPERLVGRDESREGLLEPVAVRRLDDARPARALLGRVQHAEADAVAAERRARGPGHAEGDAAVLPALDEAHPVEAHAAPAVQGTEADPEGLGLGLDLEVLELGGNGGPALLAHRDVDAAQDLALAEPDPPQLAAVEDEPQGAGAERDRELGRGVDVSGRGVRRFGSHRRSGRNVSGARGACPRSRPARRTAGELRPPCFRMASLE